MFIQTISPTASKIGKSFQRMTDNNIDIAIARAWQTFNDWRKTGYEQRAALLHKVAFLMREKIDFLSKLIASEMHNPISQSVGEITLSADIIDYYAANGAQFLADKPLNPQYGNAFIRYSPVGVLLGVEPWNFRFYQAVRFAVSNIIIGNTVLIKHTSTVPKCAMAIEDLFREAGVPAGVYTNLLISHKHASALVADDRIKVVSFTGSEVSGANITAGAGKNSKKPVFELGDNDAFIVREELILIKTTE